MKAVILKDFGGTENLVIEEIQKPAVQPDEVLVKVKAIGIDPIDIKTRKGKGMADKLKEEKPMILGWDVAGEVVHLGNDESCFTIGDAVFGTANFPGVGHSYAEYVAVPESQLALKPENISFAEAAAATQSALTAWQALVDTGHVKEGDRVLIHGAAGGVGSFAVQIAKKLGAYVVGTASAKDKDFVLELGADECVDYENEKFEEIAKDMDFILDTIGGENFVRSLTVLKPEGIIVLLPSDKKAGAEKAAEEKGIKNFHHILMHSSGKDMNEIARMLNEGSLKSHISKTYSLEEIRQAQKEVENGKHRGKIVITIS